ncbi:unnamed protein product [Caenorhabditis sp. 36 PRJEB53466]|nr:unnamed protein product [Caenorhabditis sp. 36 PRJEB53466]
MRSNRGNTEKDNIYSPISNTTRIATTSDPERCKATTATTTSKKASVECSFPPIDLSHAKRPTAAEQKDAYSVGEKLFHLCERPYVMEWAKQPLRVYTCKPNGQWSGVFQKCISEFELSRLSVRDVRVPSKIAVNRMEDVVDNTFIEPFFVGNSDKISAFYYVAPPLVKWCSSYNSRSTSQMIVHKNRRIAVTFDCNKNAVLPSPRTIVKTMILAVFTAAFVFVPPEKCDDLQDDESDNTSESSSDSLLIDDANDIVEQTSFMERLEKWDGSKMDSIYD